MWNVTKTFGYQVWTEEGPKNISQFKGQIEDTLYFTDFSIKVTDIVAIVRRI